MEEPEVPLEQVHEHLEHQAHHEPDSFIPKVALSTAIIAAFAAISSLLAGDHANEAMVSQIQSSDKWAYFQAKSIKASVLNTKIAMLESMFVTSVRSGSHPIAARPAPASIAASPVPPQYCASTDQSGSD